MQQTVNMQAAQSASDAQPPQAVAQMGAAPAMSEAPHSRSFVIIGQTTGGKRFRPSDWAERLCGALSAFGSGKRVQYSPYVGPGELDGYKAVFVDGQLEEFEPMAYRFVLHFARDNDLRVLENTCQLKPDGSAS